MGDRPSPGDEQQQQQHPHAMQHHAYHQQPVNIPASSLAPLVPPGAAAMTTTTTTAAAPATPAPTWQQQQQQQQQYQYQRPQCQQQHQTWQQQQRWQQPPPGPPPGMGPPRGQQQGPPPPRGYGYNGRGNGGGGRGGGPFPGRQGPGPGRGYNSNGGNNGGRGPPRPRQPRWVATPAEPHHPPAEHQSETQSPVTAFWLDPLPRSADDAAFRAARAALRASSAAEDAADATDPHTRCVYVLRGLPGAGKSTRASALRALAQSKGLECAVHSTDDLCVCPVSGGYLFQAERLPALHDENYSNFELSLQNKIPMVIVDNTNLVAWNYERYVVRAWARGYRVREERIGEFSSEAVAAYAERNVHGVPPERIAQMLEGFLRETEGGVLMRAPGSRVGW